MFKEMRVFALTADPFSSSHILILKDKDEEEVLPIWIGESEARKISTLLGDDVREDFETVDFIDSLLTSFSVTVEKIELYDIRDEVEACKIYLKKDDGEVITLDIRPSDGVAIALNKEVPMMVDMENLSLEDNYFDLEEESFTDYFEDSKLPSKTTKYKM